MPVNEHHLDVVRRVDVIRRIVGVRGTVELGQELRLRFDYARAVPWVRRSGSTLTAVAGPNSVLVRGGTLTASDHVHTGTVTVAFQGHYSRFADMAPGDFGGGGGGGKFKVFFGDGGHQIGGDSCGFDSNWC